MKYLPFVHFLVLLLLLTASAYAGSMRCANQIVANGEFKGSHTYLAN